MCSANKVSNTTNLELDNMLTQFWEVEKISNTNALSADEIQCEKNFAQTTRQDENGRFIVTLPLKQSPEMHGKSRAMTEKRFYSTERKLNRNESLKSYYYNFLTEYEALRHMTLVPDENVNDPAKVQYYMPPHGVFRESSLTTKLRVVFDASAPSSNGLLLNNIQLVGPVLQESLFSILVRFRKHTFIVSADITKMYRQILVEPSQRSLQRILWRSNSNDYLKTYELNTVTYGHASASYLAIRCLFQ